jgi:hypothetical protein
MEIEHRERICSMSFGELFVSIITAVFPEWIIPAYALMKNGELSARIPILLSMPMEF